MNDEELNGTTCAMISRPIMGSFPNWINYTWAMLLEFD